MGLSGCTRGYAPECCRVCTCFCKLPSFLRLFSHRALSIMHLQLESYELPVIFAPAPCKSMLDFDWPAGRPAGGIRVRAGPGGSGDQRGVARPHRGVHPEDRERGRGRVAIGRDGMGEEGTGDVGGAYRDPEAQGRRAVGRAVWARPDGHQGERSISIQVEVPWRKVSGADGASLVVARLVNRF